MSDQRRRSCSAVTFSVQSGNVTALFLWIVRLGGQRKMSVKAFLNIGYELVYADCFHFCFHLRDDRIGVGCSGLQIGCMVLINRNNNLSPL